MYQQQAQVEIVEYDKKYATAEELGKIFFRNYKQHANIANFTGVYHSMKWKYGTIMTHLIYLLFTLISASFLFFISRFFIEPIAALIISLTIGIALCYFVFARYLPNKIDKMHSDFGRGMLQPRLSDIKANFQEKGGNFWLALVENVSTGKKEIAGHVAFRYETPEELKARGANEKEKCGQLEMMGVNEEYRGIGLARKLVQAVLDFAEKNNYPVVELGAVAANYPASELYKKFGFKLSKEFAVNPAFKVISMAKRLA